MLKYLIYITLLFISFNGKSQNIDSLLASLYFENDFTTLDTNGFSFTKEHSPSTSFWAIDSFPENLVFQAQMNYESSFDTNESYQIRIGKGGHIYSFVGAFGESIPPQWRPEAWVKPSYGGGTSYAPWVDEVWQLVCVNSQLNSPPDSSYFIHQSGVYLKTPEQSEPFYSPVVAEYYSEAGNSYSIVNWGQQAHTEDLVNTGYRSGLLYYTKYTSIGKGIIQVENMIYNFGQDEITFLNAPWGLVRNSSLDHFFVSTPSNNYILSPGRFGQVPVVPVSTTGGWMAYSNHPQGNTSALGMVHPITTNTKTNIFRYGDAGDLNNPNNLRDGHVLSMIRRPFPGQLGFGKSLSFRYFFVLGASIDSVKNKILQYNLVSTAFDTAYIPNKFETDSIRYHFHQNDSEIVVSIDTTTDGLILRTSPYSNSYPLFKLVSQTEEQFISTDLYHFSDVAYDGVTQSIKLLGFIDDQSKLVVSSDTICFGDSYLFPDSSLFNDIQKSFSHISMLASQQPTYDSLIFTNLIVLPIVTGTDIQAACNSFEWIDGNTYTQSSDTVTFNIVGGAANGCDSLVTLNLTISQSTSGTDIQAACNSFEWIDGNTYTQSSDTVTFNIVGGAANGCDSLVTLDLTISQSASGTDIQTACNSFEWIDGNTYTQSSDTATFNFVGGAANGCDSLVTLDLTINTVNATVTIDDNIISAIQSGASYQWLDCDNNYQEILGETSQSFTVISNGNYAVEVTGNGCSDTSDCVIITVVGISENVLFNDVSIYPNPNNGIVNIKLGKLSGVSLKVFGINGQIILEKNNINTSTFQFELIGSPGVYFLELSAEGEKQKFRIVKR